MDKKNKKKDFKTIKKNTIKSLNEIENFLKNFNVIIKGLKVYKFFK